MSKTALAIVQSGRVAPLRENEAIRLERTGAERDRARRTGALKDPAYQRPWSKAAIAKSGNFALFIVPRRAGIFVRFARKLQRLLLKYRRSLAKRLRLC
jgi:hypothetical protein